MNDLKRRPAGTGSVYRQTYRGRDGSRRQSRFYSISYVARDGETVRESTGQSTQEAAEAILARRIAGRDGTAPDMGSLAGLLRLTGLQAMVLGSPLVYIWSRGADVLYVGKGSAGLHRVFNPRHQHLGGNVILPTDVIDLVPAGTPERADEIERKLIAQLRPRFNVRLNNGTPP
jgi:hypothetical protein